MPRLTGYSSLAGRFSASKEIQLFGRLHRDLFNVSRLTTGREPADQIDETPTEFLHDEQSRRFKDHFQVFGHPIIVQAHNT